jgi:hypothetical protein
MWAASELSAEQFTHDLGGSFRSVRDTLVHIIAGEWVRADGSCMPGRATLDEGYEEGKRYRQFSMTGSGAHYVVHLEVVT